MELKRGDGVVVIVLAAHREDDAAALQLAQVALERAERLAFAEPAHADPFDAVVTDDAAPQRVVEIDDDALDDAAALAEHDVDEPRSRSGASQ